MRKEFNIRDKVKGKAVLKQINSNPDFDIHDSATGENIGDVFWGYEDEKHFLQWIADAINEKLERDEQG